MKFIHDVLDRLTAQNTDFARTILVFPNRRPAVFFQKAFIQRGHQGFLPEMLSIQELLQRESDDALISGVPLWLEAFGVYQGRHPSERFSDFLKWFTAVEKDWEDILSYSEDSSRLLEFMVDEERIKNWGMELGTETDIQKKHLDFWRNMRDFLPKLERHLEKNKLATFGMMSSRVRRAEHTEDFAKGYKLVFIGFNAVTPTEEFLMKSLRKEGRAELFFMADHYYVDDPGHEAGKYLRDILRWNIFSKEKPLEYVYDDFIQPKSIEVYSAPGELSQIPILNEILDTSTDPQDLTETALILMNEDMALPVISALPNSGVNITMGISLKNLPLSQAISQAFELIKKRKSQSADFYYKDLLQFFRQMRDTGLFPDLFSEMERKTSSQKNSYIPVGIFSSEDEKTILQLLNPDCPAAEMATHWKMYLQHAIREELNDVLYESLHFYLASFTTLEDFLQQVSFEISLDDLRYLLQKINSGQQVSFEGDPLGGLQMMGLLETRLLNFKNIIILSANEGRLPQGKNMSSLIPFDVRKNYGLPTYVENDALFSYHFYRLIQSAERIHLVYNSATSGIQADEKSRFIRQLELESPHQPVQHHFSNASRIGGARREVVIEKDPVILDVLKAWSQKISPSSLSSYVYDPKNFYLERIFGFNEDDGPEETIDAKLYGTLTHHMLEKIYQKFENTYLKVEDLDRVKRDFIQNPVKYTEGLGFHANFFSKGYNYLQLKTAAYIVENILEKDIQDMNNGDSVFLVANELPFDNIPHRLDDGRTVYFKGKMDRVEIRNRTLRIIDYKSGNFYKLPKNINDEESIFKNSKYRFVLQLGIYHLAIPHLTIPRESYDVVEIGVWSIKSYRKGFQAYENFDEVSQLVIAHLDMLIEEILNPELPFTGASAQEEEENVQESF